MEMLFMQFMQSNYVDLIGFVYVECAPPPVMYFPSAVRTAHLRPLNTHTHTHTHARHKHTLRAAVWDIMWCLLFCKYSYGLVPF